MQFARSAGLVTLSLRYGPIVDAGSSGRDTSEGVNRVQRELSLRLIFAFHNQCELDTTLDGTSQVRAQMGNPMSRKSHEHDPFFCSGHQVIQHLVDTPYRS